MLRLAFRNLFQSKARLVVSTGGVALALVLILALDAIFTGVEQQITAYIDHAGADVWVSQSGVRNLHMSSSSLPATTAAEVEAVPGVTSVTPILYMTNMIAVGQDRYVAYVIGLPPDPAAGRPWRIAEGKAVPASGETIIDRGVAGQLGVGIGGQVKILGREFTIAGLSEGAASLINSIAFISMDDFAALRSGPQTVSFLLVRVAARQSSEVVAAQIEREVAGVTAQSTAAFATQERQIVKDMSTDIVTIMNSVGFLIGLAVLSLTVYMATLARRAEYGMLKALGARNRHLYTVVLAQAFTSVALGLAVAWAVTIALTFVVPRVALNLNLQISALSLAKVAAVSAFLAALSAILPVRQIAGLDPARVFKGA
jgi:putative ABC transport system permease protein